MSWGYCLNTEFILKGIVEVLVLLEGVSCIPLMERKLSGR